MTTLLLAAYYPEAELRALRDAGPIRTNYPLAGTPIATLLK